MLIPRFSCDHFKILVTNDSSNGTHCVAFMEQYCSEHFDLRISTLVPTTARVIGLGAVGARIAIANPEGSLQSLGPLLFLLTLFIFSINVLICGKLPKKSANYKTTYVHPQELPSFSSNHTYFWNGSPITSILFFFTSGLSSVYIFPSSQALSSFRVRTSLVLHSQGDCPPSGLMWMSNGIVLC